MSNILQRAAKRDQLESRYATDERGDTPAKACRSRLAAEVSLRVSGLDPCRVKVSTIVNAGSGPGDMSAPRGRPRQVSPNGSVANLFDYASDSTRDMARKPQEKSWVKTTRLQAAPGELPRPHRVLCRCSIESPWRNVTYPAHCAPSERRKAVARSPSMLRHPKSTTTARASSTAR